MSSLLDVCLVFTCGISAVYCLAVLFLTYILFFLLSAVCQKYAEIIVVGTRCAHACARLGVAPRLGLDVGALAVVGSGAPWGPGSVQGFGFPAGNFEAWLSGLWLGFQVDQRPGSPH